jgi:uncharacterized membrane protein (DUF373 family)
MPESAPHHASPESEHAFSPAVLRQLELLDNLAHVVVALLFILMAATVLIHTGFVFARQVPYIATVPQPETTSTSTEAAKPTATSSEDKPQGTEDSKKPGTPGSSGEKPQGTAGITQDPFYRISLELLSSILYAVIILELLRTIITYLQTHDIQAIMQEFIVVGIISSVRKILLVGAAASLSGSSGIEFIQEATGVLLNIGGIVLLIVGLVLLRRGYGKREKGESTEHPPAD